MESDPLAALTVVIPTYGRQRLLSRQAEFWGGTRVTVEILDGSPAPWTSAADLSPNMRYHHRPESIERRLGWAAQRLETPYAVLLSDDEFFLPAALRSCIERLAADPRMAACKGLAVEFDFRGDRVEAKHSYTGLRGYRLDQATPRERMIGHMRPYVMATLWAVMPARVFSQTLRAMSDRTFRSAAAGEIQTSLVAAAMGTCAVLDELMWLRSAENENIWWASGRQPFARWLTDQANSAEVEEFINATHRAILQGGVPGVEARDIADAIAAYADWSRAAVRYSLRERLLGSLLHRLPDGLRNTIARRQAAARAAAVPSRSLGEVGAELSREGIDVDAKALARVEDIITRFHRGEPAPSLAV